MSKIEELYDLYLDEGLLTEAVSLSDFKNADEDQRDQLYSLAKDNNLISEDIVDFTTFDTAWGEDVLEGEVVEEETIEPWSGEGGEEGQVFNKGRNYTGEEVVFEEDDDTPDTFKSTEHAISREDFEKSEEDFVKDHREKLKEFGVKITQSSMPFYDRITVQGMHGTKTFNLDSKYNKEVKGFFSKAPGALMDDPVSDYDEFVDFIYKQKTAPESVLLLAEQGLIPEEVEFRDTTDPFYDPTDKPEYATGLEYYNHGTRSNAPLTNDQALETVGIADGAIMQTLMNSNKLLELKEGVLQASVEQIKNDANLLDDLKNIAFQQYQAKESLLNKGLNTEPKHVKYLSEDSFGKIWEARWEALLPEVAKEQQKNVDEVKGEITPAEEEKFSNKYNKEQLAKGNNAEIVKLNDLIKKDNEAIKKYEDRLANTNLPPNERASIQNALNVAKSSKKTHVDEWSEANKIWTFSIEGTQQIGRLTDDGHWINEEVIDPEEQERLRKLAKTAEENAVAEVSNNVPSNPHLTPQENLEIMSADSKLQLLTTRRIGKDYEMFIPIEVLSETIGGKIAGVSGLMKDLQSGGNVYRKLLMNPNLDIKKVYNDGGFKISYTELADLGINSEEFEGFIDQIGISFIGDRDWWGDKGIISQKEIDSYQTWESRFRDDRAIAEGLWNAANLNQDFGTIKKPGTEIYDVPGHLANFVTSAIGEFAPRWFDASPEETKYVTGYGSARGRLSDIISEIDIVKDNYNASKAVKSGELAKIQLTDGQKEALASNFAQDVANGVGQFVPMMIEFAGITIATEGIATIPAVAARLARMAPLTRHLLMAGVEEAKMQVIFDMGPGAGASFYGLGNITKNMFKFAGPLRFAQGLFDNTLKEGVVAGIASEVGHVSEKGYDAMFNNKDFAMEMDELYGDADEWTRRMLVAGATFGITGGHKLKKADFYTQRRKLKVVSYLNNKAESIENEIYKTKEKAEEGIKDEAPGGPRKALTEKDIETYGTKKQKRKLRQYTQSMAEISAMYHAQAVSEKLDINRVKKGEMTLDEFEKNFDEMYTQPINNMLSEMTNGKYKPPSVKFTNDRSYFLKGQTARYVPEAGVNKEGVIYLDFDKYTPGKAIHEFTHLAINKYFDINPTAKSSFLRKFGELFKEQDLFELITGKKDTDAEGKEVSYTGEDLMKEVSEEYAPELKEAAKGGPEAVESLRSEEFLTNLVEILSNPEFYTNNPRRSTNILKKAKDMVADIFSRNGMKEVKAPETAQEMVDLLVSLGESMRQGEAFTPKFKKFLEAFNIEGENVVQQTKEAKEIKEKKTEEKKTEEGKAAKDLKTTLDKYSNVGERIIKTEREWNAKKAYIDPDTKQKVRRSPKEIAALEIIDGGILDGEIAKRFKSDNMYGHSKAAYMQRMRDKMKDVLLNYKPEKQMGLPEDKRGLAGWLTSPITIDNKFKEVLEEFKKNPKRDDPTYEDKGTREQSYEMPSSERGAEVPLDKQVDPRDLIPGVKKRRNESTGKFDYESPAIKNIENKIQEMLDNIGLDAMLEVKKDGAPGKQAVTYNKLRSLDSNPASEFFGVPASKISGKGAKAKNFSGPQAKSAQMKIARNLERIFKLMPKSNTPTFMAPSMKDGKIQYGKDGKAKMVNVSEGDFVNLPTGLPKNLQKALFEKGERIGNPYKFTLKDGVGIVDFANALGIEYKPGSKLGGKEDFAVRTTDSQAIQGMVELVDRAITNKVFRNYLEKQINVKGEKGEVKYSESQIRKLILNAADGKNIGMAAKEWKSTLDKLATALRKDFEKQSGKKISINEMIKAEEDFFSSDIELGLELEKNNPDLYDFLSKRILDITKETQAKQRNTNYISTVKSGSSTNEYIKDFAKQHKISESKAKEILDRIVSQEAFRFTKDGSKEWRKGPLKAFQKQQKDFVENWLPKEIVDGLTMSQIEQLFGNSERVNAKGTELGITNEARDKMLSKVKSIDENPNLSKKTKELIKSVDWKNIKAQNIDAVFKTYNKLIKEGLSDRKAKFEALKKIKGKQERSNYEKAQEALTSLKQDYINYNSKNNNLENAMSFIYNLHKGNTNMVKGMRGNVWTEWFYVTEGNQGPSMENPLYKSSYEKALEFSNNKDNWSKLTEGWKAKGSKIRSKEEYADERAKNFSKLKGEHLQPSAGESGRETLDLFLGKTGKPRTIRELLDNTQFQAPKGILDLVDKAFGPTATYATKRLALPELVNYLKETYNWKYIEGKPGGKTLYDYVLEVSKNDLLTSVEGREIFRNKELLNDVVLKDAIFEYGLNPTEANRLLIKNRVKNLKEYKKVYDENQNIASEASMASKDLSQSKILNELTKRDKAIRLANKRNKTIKKARVFDFDDTVAKTKSKVFATKDGKKKTLTAEQFAKNGEKLEAEGWKMDFSDFNKVVDGKKGPLFDVMKKMKEAKGDRDIFILTARSPESAKAIHRFLKEMGVDIPLKNIKGLGDSSPYAKSDWIMEKAAEGYNDFYFADDHKANVKAVRDALEVIDVKSQTQQAYAAKDLNTRFNEIIEQKKGIGKEKVFSDIKAEIRGAEARRQKFFIPPSAEDFLGLLYTTLPKGVKGEKALEFYKESLLDPYSRAMENLSTDRINLMNDFKTLKKELDVPKDLQKQTESGFTNEQAVRVHLWNKTGKEIPGLSKADLKELNDIVKNNPKLEAFADQILAITKGDGYSTPTKNWNAGTITTDLIDVLNTTKRSKYLETWKQNADIIFSKDNLNKLEAGFGKGYREAVENSLARMKSGSNRIAGGNKLSNRILDYINNSTAVTMFMNTRSAVLQTISAANFINWSFNSPYHAGKAFANQPQYWRDFIKLMNSDYLVDRRNGLKLNINESEIANAAKTSKNKAKAALSYILEKGYLPTKFADSFAIASGGATWYRNKIKDLMKDGLMTEKEAEIQAMKEFRDIAEMSQQSSDPSKISSQQSSDLGRIILQYVNTPMQYARMQKRDIQDIINKRRMPGKTLAQSNRVRASRIAYYMFLQNMIFNALQQGLFAIGFGDDGIDEKDEKKLFKTANGMLDSSLRGLGLAGVTVQVIKNLGIDIYDRSQKKRPEYSDAWIKLLEFSPAIKSKLSKLRSAAWPFDSKKRRAEVFEKGFSLDNPAYESMAKVISATTNAPLDRVYSKVNNLKAAASDEAEAWQSIAMFLGSPSWLIMEDDKPKSKSKSKSSSKGGYKRKTYKRKTYKR